MLSFISMIVIEASYATEKKATLEVVLAKEAELIKSRTCIVHLLKLSLSVFLSPFPFSFPFLCSCFCLCFQQKFHFGFFRWMPGSE